MPITFFHDRSSDETPADLVVRALRDACPELEARHVSLTRVSGGHFAGRHTEWWDWRLADGAPEVTVPSILDEGDPDDAPFRASGGFLVVPAGFSTAYVHMFRPGESDRIAARIWIVKFAGTDIGAPRGACDPIDPGLLALQASVAAGLGRPDAVFATGAWVQVDPVHGGVIVIEPDAAGLRVTCLVESYVDTDDGVPLSEEDRDQLCQLARAALDEELTPRLAELGMRASSGAVWSGDEDEHGGHAVEQWEKVVPDAEAVIALVRAIDAEPCRRDGLAS